MKLAVQSFLPTDTVTRIEWGTYGLFLHIKWSTEIGKLPVIGDRVDILNNIEVHMKLQDITVPIKGVWYVYNVHEYKNVHRAFNVVLIRNNKYLCQMGDGTSMHIKELEKIINISGYADTAQLYVTMDRRKKNYKNIVDLARKIKPNSLPIFKLDGTIEYKNIYDRPNDFLVLYNAFDELHYSPGRAPLEATTDFSYYYWLGNEYAVDDVFLEPGTIVCRRMPSRNKKEEESNKPVPEKDIYICTHTIIQMPMGSRENYSTPKIYLARLFDRTEYNQAYAEELGKYLDSDKISNDKYNVSGLMVNRLKRYYDDGE